MITQLGSLLTTPCYLTCTMITDVGPLLTTPGYLTYTMITEVGSLLPTSHYLTCNMITEVNSLLITPCYLTWTDNRGSLSDDNILLTKLYMIVQPRKIWPFIIISNFVSDYIDEFYQIKTKGITGLKRNDLYGRYFIGLEPILAESYVHYFC